MDRPDLTELDATGEQYGLILEGSTLEARAWSGPFATKEAAEKEVAKLAGLGFPIASHVVTWDARRVALAKAMDERGIHPNDDYDFSDLIDILAGERECGRYGAIKHDETYSVIDVCDTLEEAAASLQNSIGEDTLNSPEGVLDLDTGKLASPKVSVSVSFDD
jgi:hypothetical protein